MQGAPQIISQMSRSCRWPALLGVLALVGCGYSPTFPPEARERAAAVDCAVTQCVDFVYIHGAATHTEADRQYVLGRVDLMHEELSAALYATPEFVEGALENGRLAIAPEPLLYFWGGDITLVRDIETIEAMLDARQEREGGGVRKFYGQVHRRMSEAIHDLFWAASDGHRYQISDSLHAKVRESRGQGRKVVLLGYSAGSVILTSYALHRVRGIHLDEFAQILRGSDALRELFAGRDEWTCGEALLDSGLVEMDERGLLRARLEDARTDGELDVDAFREAYWQDRLAALPALTRRYCLDDDTLIGGVTFGSMANLLASKSDDAAGEMLVLAARELKRDGAFWLNVNHADDLVGFNVYPEVDLTARLERKLGLPPVAGAGFTRSAEPEYRGATLVSAHSWYLTDPPAFAALVADTYARGYRESRSMSASSSTATDSGTSPRAD